MYNNSYEEYIRNILGYSNQTNNPYANYNFQSEYDNAQVSQIQELENCYPEIYKIVYPMITKICNNCETPITRDTIERMTDEIYSAVESNNEINININLGNEIRQDEENRNTSNRSNISQTVKKEVKEPAIKEKLSMESSREDRQFRNRDLRDLIQILIIRELLGRLGFPRQRPPMPPMRTPFSGGHSMLGQMPPIMPRGYEYSYLDIYEN